MWMGNVITAPSDSNGIAIYLTCLAVERRYIASGKISQFRELTSKPVAMLSS